MDCCDAVYCINLKRRPDRKEKVEKQLDKMGISANRVWWWDAVDGKEIEDGCIDDRQIDRSMRSRYSTAEVACALSHMQVWKDVVNRGLRSAMIFEDDVSGREDSLERLSRSWEQIPSDWDVVLIGMWDWDPDNAKRVGPDVVDPGFPVQMHAYCVTLRGVKRLLDSVRPCEYPIDVELALASERGDVRVYGFEPSLMTQQVDSYSDLQFQRSIHWAIRQVSPTDARKIARFAVLLAAGFLASATVGRPGRSVAWMAVPFLLAACFASRTGWIAFGIYASTATVGALAEAFVYRRAFGKE